MRSNPFIRAKVLEIRNRKAERLMDKKHALVYNDPQVYRPASKKHYTAQQIADFKNEYKKEIRAERNKTIGTWILTLVATPIVLYILIRFISYDFGVY